MTQKIYRKKTSKTENKDTYKKIRYMNLTQQTVTKTLSGTIKKIFV